MVDKKSINKHSTAVTGQPLPCSIYIDGYLKKTLEDLNTLKNKNFDGITLITGEEGAGKTTLAMQMALYMDSSFNNNHIVFNANQFEEAIERLPPGSAILWDEADDTGSGWASEMMVALKKTFKRIRKRNFIVFLVTPTFHDLNKYFAIHRTRFLINVRADFVTRGFFYFFGREAKKKLYIYGKKEMDMKAWKPNFWGRFTDYPPNFPIDMDAYEDAKDQATSVAFQKAEGKKDIRIDMYDNLTKWLSSHGVDYTRKDLSFILGVSERQVSRYRAEVDLTR